MICNKNDVKKTCNNEKNTNRFDIFLAQISATGTFKATKVNAVGIDKAGLIFQINQQSYLQVRQYP